MSTLDSELLLDYARLVDALPIVAWVAKPSGEIVHMSPAWQSLTGHAEFQLADGAYRDLIHADDLTQARENWHTMAPGAHYQGEMRVRFASGEYRWLLALASPIRDERGEVAGWVGTATDIHDRHLAEAALAERNALLERSEGRYRLIAESIPGTTWTAKPDGQLDHVGEGNTPWPRMPPGDRLGERWIEVVHPDDRERVIRRWTHSVQSGDPYEINFRVHMADGSYRWQLVRALPQRDDAERIVQWIGVNVDIDETMRADAEREKFVALAENSNDIVGMTDVDGTIVYFNPAALDFLGLTRADFGKYHFLDKFTEDDLPFVKSQIVPALEERGMWAAEFRFKNFATGEPLAVFYNVFVLRDALGEKIGYATISRDIRERQRVEIGLRALAEAGKAMHNSLDLNGTLQNIADAAVAGFATGCSFEVERPDGSIDTITIGARNDEQRAKAWLAAKTRNPNVAADHPIRRAIHKGESTLMQTLPVSFLESTGLDAHIGRGKGRIDLRSLIYVPVRSARDGRAVGALSCAIDSSDPRGVYTEDDVRFAEEIALRAGIAFDNANTYERANRIAVELQAASLPAALPCTPALRLFADYRPATDETTIGGDWYDAFPLADGRVAITVGDVVGHGLQAAVRMSKLRQAMQAAAMLSPDPVVMLEVANRTLRLFERDIFASALAAIYAPAGGQIEIASAGHPGPTVLRRDGSVREFSFPGFMLGFQDEPSFERHPVELGAGDTIVFYTDGLVEAGRDDAAGRARLSGALLRAEVLGAPNPAYAIVEHVLEGASIRDDIAVLVARVDGP